MSSILTSRLLRGLPLFPDDTLDPKLYNALAAIHLALNNFDDAVELATGVQAYPSTEQAGIGLSGAILTGNATRMYAPASVAITKGHILNLFDSGGGVLKARLAVNSALATMAHCVARTNAAPGQLVEMNWLRCVTNDIAGMTPGIRYWLSATPGLVQNTMPATVVKQVVGLAVAASTLIVDMSLNGTQS